MSNENRKNEYNNMVEYMYTKTNEEQLDNFMYG